MSHVDDGTLHAYLDGELSAAERSRMDEHLSGCAACRDRLEEERALVARASELLALAAPSAREPPPYGEIRPLARRWWRVRIPLAWAATVVLALAAGWYLRGAAVPETPTQEADRIARPAPIPAVQRKAGPRKTVETQPSPAGAVARFEAKTSPAAELTAPGAPTAAPPPVVARAALRAENVDEVAVWQPVTPAAARAILGAEPVALPEVPIRQIMQSPSGDGGILVEQQLDTATVIRLYEWRAGAEAVRAQPAPAEGRARRDAASERLARYVGPLRVEIAGPLPVDSLSKLLERIR